MIVLFFRSVQASYQMKHEYEPINPDVFYVRHTATLPSYLLIARHILELLFQLPDPNQHSNEKAKNLHRSNDLKHCCLLSLPA